MALPIPKTDIQMMSEALIDGGLVESAAVVDYDNNYGSLGFTAVDVDIIEQFQPLLTVIFDIPVVQRSLRGEVGIKQHSYEFANTVTADNDGALAAYTDIENYWYTNTTYDFYHAHRRLSRQAIETAAPDIIKQTVDFPLAWSLAQHAETLIFSALENAATKANTDSAFAITESSVKAATVRLTRSGSGTPFTGWETGRPVWITGTTNYNGRHIATYVSTSVIDLRGVTVVGAENGTLSGGVLTSVDSGNYWALGSGVEVTWEKLFERINYMFKTWDVVVTDVYTTPDIYNRLIDAIDAPRAIWFQHAGITLKKSNKITANRVLLLDAKRIGRAEFETFPAHMGVVTGGAGLEVRKSMKGGFRCTHPHAIGVIAEDTA